MGKITQWTPEWQLAREDLYAIYNNQFYSVHQVIEIILHIHTETNL